MFRAHLKAFRDRLNGHSALATDLRPEVDRLFNQARLGAEAWNDPTHQAALTKMVAGWQEQFQDRPEAFLTVLTEQAQEVMDAAYHVHVPQLSSIIENGLQGQVMTWDKVVYERNGLTVKGMGLPAWQARNINPPCLRRAFETQAPSRRTGPALA